MKLLAVLVVLGFALAARAAEEPAKPLPTKRHVEAEAEIDLASKPIRAARPASLSLSALGKTPFGGLVADMNLHPYLGLGIGYGYFSVDGIHGNFIPLFLQGYFLQSNFSPYVEAGANFVTVKFDGASSILNSTFNGTQWILGGGLEYRFDFGLLLRLDAVRFMQARIWSPGLAIGYSVLIF